MPAERLHRSLAVENEALAVQLLEISPSWSSVVTFYAALHWVDAFLGRNLGSHPRNHQERAAYLSRISELQPIERPYVRLRTGSESVRYMGAHVSRQQAERLIQDQLAAIKSHVFDLIG